MLFHNRRSLAAGALTTLVLAGCGPTAMLSASSASRVGALDSSQPAHGLYTFHAMDNDLDRGSDQAEEVAATATRSRGVAGVALYDGSEPNDTQLFVGTPGLRASVKAVREVDSGTAAALGDFLTAALKVAPAQRQHLVMADHGGGIIRGICSDWNGPGGKKIIHLHEVAATLRDKPIDVMFFDACFMNMAEVAYELKDVSKVVVAAQTTTYAGYFPYGAVVQQLDSGTEATGLARGLVNTIDRASRYNGIAWGAVDTSKTRAMAQAVSKLSKAAIAALPAHKAEMLDALNNAISYGGETDPRLTMYNQYRDYGSVMANLAKVSDPAVSASAKEALAAGRASILAATARSGRNLQLEGAMGTALYATTEGYVEEKYLQRSWSRDTGWGEFLGKLNSRNNWAPSVKRDPFPFAFPNRKK